MKLNKNISWELENIKNSVCPESLILSSSTKRFSIRSHVTTGKVLWVNAELEKQQTVP